jgi:hypothetical protein
MPARRGTNEDEPKKNPIDLEEIKYGKAGSGEELNIISENELEDALNISPYQMRRLREMGLPFVSIPRKNGTASEKRFYLIRSVMQFLKSIEAVLPQPTVEKIEVDKTEKEIKPNAED